MNLHIFVNLKLTGYTSLCQTLDVNLLKNSMGKYKFVLR